MSAGDKNMQFKKKPLQYQKKNRDSDSRGQSEARSAASQEEKLTFSTYASSGKQLITSAGRSYYQPYEHLPSSSRFWYPSAFPELHHGRDARSRKLLINFLHYCKLIMSRVIIDADFLRKRAEHNEGCLNTLEEIALHQLNIEKIENFDKLIRHVKILLLQNNLISKMENLSKLKELTYLNLALNNIEVIEGLEGCESIEKLDMTCNFISAERFFESLINLKKCSSLRELHFLGNPLTE